MEGPTGLGWVRPSWTRVWFEVYWVGVNSGWEYSSNMRVGVIPPNRADHSDPLERRQRRRWADAGHGKGAAAARPVLEQHAAAGRAQPAEQWLGAAGRGRGAGPGRKKRGARGSEEERRTEARTSHGRRRGRERAARQGRAAAAGVAGSEWRLERGQGRESTGGVELRQERVVAGGVVAGVSRSMADSWPGGERRPAAPQGQATGGAT